MVRALACHVGDPGSISGVCLYFILFWSLKIDLVSKKVEFETFLNPFSLNAQRLYCFYYIHIRSQNPIEKSFVMLFEVTNLKWIRLGVQNVRWQNIKISFKQADFHAKIKLILETKN